MGAGTGDGEGEREGGGGDRHFSASLPEPARLWIQWSAAPSSAQLPDLQVELRFVLGKGHTVFHLYLPFI